jgi:hypothetical protein
MTFSPSQNSALCGRGNWAKTSSTNLTTSPRFCPARFSASGVLLVGDVLVEVGVRECPDATALFAADATGALLAAEFTDAHV